METHPSLLCSPLHSQLPSAASNRAIYTLVKTRSLPLSEKPSAFYSRTPGSQRGTEHRAGLVFGFAVEFSFPTSLRKTCYPGLTFPRLS